MKELKPLREEIDRIDSEIAGLLNRRMEAVRSIREYKRKNDLPVEDLLREEEILMGLKPGKLDESFLRELYQVIFRYSKSFQK